MIKLKENCTETVNKIFKFVTINNIPHDLSERHFKGKARIFIKNNFVNLEELEEFGFFDINNYYSDSDRTEELFKLMMTLGVLKHEIVCILKPKRKEIDFGKLTRKVSPGLEAYKYTSFNKMDIGISKKSYGLLFE